MNATTRRSDERLDGSRVRAYGSSAISPLDLMLRRAAQHSRRGARADDRVLALAIEGGGLAGVVSGGMCVALEAAGLVDAVDVIYGTSSGALNGSYTAAGQAAMGCTSYEDTANRRFANPLRLLAGRPAIDFDSSSTRSSPSASRTTTPGWPRAPPFCALAANLETGASQVLTDFTSVEDLRAAVRVSCSIPLLSGRPVVYRGVPMADGALFESMPFHAAMAGGATDVIVLRSRPASHRKQPYARHAVALLKRLAHPALADLVQARPALYNRHAGELEKLTQRRGAVVQIVPPEGAALVGQLETSPQRIRAGLEVGAQAAAAALGLSISHLVWQPTAHLSEIPSAKESLHE